MVQNMSKRIRIMIPTCLILFCCFFAGGAVSLLASVPFFRASRQNPEEICVVLDAGHGGKDPGKIAVDETLEKDINLALVQRLEILLSNKDIQVVLTRDSDDSLSDGFSGGTKREDMNHRLNIIEKADADLTVSIHQNSYTDSSACGPQVFYYSKSSQGKEFAEVMQQSLNDTLCPSSPRAAKANDEYFMLKKTPTPTIIVECGFLSNPTETALLNNEAYRDLIVRAIYLGICDYLELGEEANLEE